MAYSQSSQVAALIVGTQETQQGSQTSQLGALVVLSDYDIAKYTDTAQLGALVVAYETPLDGPITSQLSGLVVYGEGVREDFTQRAWAFTLDGHEFYVLHLGKLGTWVYDLTTRQWSNWYTQGYPTWNMEQGWNWFEDVVIAGGIQGPEVWRLDPTAGLDEGFRAIYRYVTGLATLRGREPTIDAFALRLTVSHDEQVEPGPATMRMRFSDDQGVSWSQFYEVTLDVDNSDQWIDYRSLGTMRSPGRVFEISDEGGPVRISGAWLDVGDEDGQPQ